MRTQSNATGVNSRGTQTDLQQYDLKLQPSPLVPRKQLKKESAMNQAFIRGFFDELEKSAAAGALLGRALTSGKGALGKATSWVGGQAKKDPMGTAMNAMQAIQMGSGVAGRVRQGRSQHKAALSGQAGVQAKKRTGLMGGLGFSGAV